MSHKTPSTTMRQIKCICVGDAAVGKTCMLKCYRTKMFSKEYVPTMMESHEGQIVSNGRPIDLTLWDTAGQEEYDRLRPLSYTDADVFIVCYSVNSPTSLDNVGTKWLPEIRHYCPDTPILLVGTKADTRKEFCGSKTFIDNGNMSAFVDLAWRGKKHGIDRIMECSAKSQEGLKDVFDEAVTLALAVRIKPKERRNRCVLM